MSEAYNSADRVRDMQFHQLSCVVEEHKEGKEVDLSSALWHNSGEGFAFPVTSVRKKCNETGTYYSFIIAEDQLRQPNDISLPVEESKVSRDSVNLPKRQIVPARVN